MVGTLKSRQQILPVVAADKGDELFKHDKALYVNRTLPGFIEENWDKFPKGSVLIDEVYPAPSFATISRLEENGVMVFHVAGLPGKVVPRMPGEYKDAVPCCAATPGKENDVIIKRVVPDGN